MRESVTIRIIPIPEAKREPNPYVTAGNDALGVVTFTSEKAGKILGPVGAVISVVNDPSPTNIVITGAGLIPGPDVPIAIGTIAWDFSNGAASLINQVFTPDTPEKIEDGSGHMVPNPAFQEQNICQDLGCE